MNAEYPLFRLLWRPGVLLDLVVTTVFAAMLSGVGIVAGQVLLHGRGTIFGLGTPAEYPPVDVAENLHVCLLAGAVIGTVASYAMQDLLYCRFSWMLPQLRARLRVGLWTLALLAAGIGGGFGLLLGAHDGGPGPLQGTALGLAGFALGNQLWDPKIGRGFSFGMLFLLVAAVVGADSLARGIEQVPWVTPVAAVLLVVLSIHRATTREGARLRALVPRVQLGASFRAARDLPPPKLFGGATTRVWREGRVLDRRSWIRALHYEDAGWLRSGWKARLAWVVVPVALLACGGNFAMAWSEHQSLLASVRAVAAGVFGKVGDLTFPNFIGLGVALAAIIHVLNTRLDLRRGVAYPLSRRERATIIWLAAMRQGLTMLLSLTVILFLFGLAAAWYAEVEVTLHGVPEVLVAALVIAPVLPILQGVRLFFLDSGRVPANSVAFGAGAGVVGILFVVLVELSVVPLRLAAPRPPVFVVLIVAPVLWAWLELGFRMALRSWYATGDLC